MVEAARGGGPAHREFSRALMVSDRAVREWAASAFAQAHPGIKNDLEALPTLGKPEDHYHLARRAVRRATAVADRETLQRVVNVLTVLVSAVPDLDTEGSLTANRLTFETIGTRAADVLLAAAPMLGGTDFVVDQANGILRDFVAVDGWKNQLGPRFE